MLPYTNKEIVDCFLSAKNPNSAVKTFLKKEVKKGDQAGKFAKTFRSVLTSADTQKESRVGGFVEKYLPDYEMHFISIASYAHPEIVENVANEIIDQFAEEFNETYEMDGDDLKVKDKTNFDRIGKQSLGIIDSKLTEHGFGSNAFLKNVVMVSIFDYKVLEVVETLV